MRQTLAHASWVNQAELLNRAFSARYVRRHSFRSPEQMRRHLKESAPEYNRLYAHPFRWTFTPTNSSAGTIAMTAKSLRLYDQVH